MALGEAGERGRTEGKLARQQLKESGGHVGSEDYPGAPQTWATVGRYAGKGIQWLPRWGPA